MPFVDRQGLNGYNICSPVLKYICKVIIRYMPTLMRRKQGGLERFVASLPVIDERILIHMRFAESIVSSALESAVSTSVGIWVIQEGEALLQIGV